MTPKTGKTLVAKLMLHVPVHSELMNKKLALFTAGDKRTHAQHPYSRKRPKDTEPQEAVC